jgi:hypothetical protein
MFEEIRTTHCRHRRFLGIAAMTIAADRTTRCKRSIISISLFSANAICMNCGFRSTPVYSTCPVGIRRYYTQPRGMLAQSFREGKSLSRWRGTG